MISLFMTFSDPAGERRIHPDEVDAVAELVGSIPDTTEGLLFTPLEQSVDHPYKADGSGPVFALQLRFPDLLACEAAMDRGGVLAGLATGAGLASLTGLDVTHQVMLTRAFPVEVAEHPAGTTAPCSYLVHYPGPAEDMNAWNLHYLEHHPSIMRTFPDVSRSTPGSIGSTGCCRSASSTCSATSWCSTARKPSRTRSAPT
ncbi:hypothetical protein J4G48_0018965 [Bradyrhizobium barranii subsp. apii]|uniref:hypothetical protein n=1 Tax=Bradyrhizobium barranii TaxID=2992140 RepID=UPI001CD625F7|nr:hypothetical protein [Bradyrhizobium barranii]UPT99981.1 hypothetical protein J4G48_0018965 [Bradyrhizobium barranii subsp. apii]